jgi:hypothetical protein
VKRNYDFEVQLLEKQDNLKAVSISDLMSALARSKAIRGEYDDISTSCHKAGLHLI